MQDLKGSETPITQLSLDQGNALDLFILYACAAGRPGDFHGGLNSIRSRISAASLTGHRAPGCKEAFVLRTLIFCGIVQVAAKERRAVDRAVPFRELTDEFPDKCPGLISRAIVTGNCLPILYANHKDCTGYRPADISRF
jgi:hypothetical protein